MNTRSSSANDCLENDGQPGKVKLHFVGVTTLSNAADDIDKIEHIQSARSLRRVPCNLTSAQKQAFFNAAADRTGTSCR